MKGLFLFFVGDFLGVHVQGFALEFANEGGDAFLDVGDAGEAGIFGVHGYFELRRRNHRVVGEVGVFAVEFREFSKGVENGGEGFGVALAARHLEAFFAALEKEVLAPLAADLPEVAEAYLDEGEVFVGF